MKRPIFKLIEFIVDHTFYVGGVPRIYKAGERAELRDHLADKMVRIGIAKTPDKTMALAFEEYSVN